MKRVLLCLLAAIALLPCCTSTESDVDNPNDNTGGLGTTDTSLAVISGQIVAINTTITNLQKSQSDLSNYIIDLKSTDATLQSQITTNATKITDLKLALNELSDNVEQSDAAIAAVKSDLLAEMESMQSEMESELSKIESTIATLEEKDEVIEEQITTLQSYVDSEIDTTKDWVEATFATLDQHNTLSEEVATLKEEMTSLNSSITSLESKLRDEYTKSIEIAISTLDADVAESLTTLTSEITTSYTTAITTAKEEISEAYSSAIESSIATLESSMKVWINEQFAGYYTIAESDAALATLKGDIEDDLLAQKSYLESLINENVDDIETIETTIDGIDTAIAANAADISVLQDNLATAKSDITAAYKEAIETAITNNNGNFNEDINSQLTAINDRVDSKVEAINTALTALTTRVDTLESDVTTIKNTLLGIQEQISDIMSRLQSVVYLPDYTDGNATMRYDLYGGTTTLRYKINPASAAADLAAVWQSAIGVEVLYTRTRSTAGDRVDLEVISASAEDDVLTIVASPSNLDENFFKGFLGASVSLNISDGNNDLSTEYVNMIVGTYPDLRSVEINNSEDLLLFAKFIRYVDDAKDIDATLTNDIDLADIKWVPIYDYNGDFDGCGHTISNLTIDSYGSFIGLFGSIKYGSISNLILKNPNIKGDDYVGAICGSAEYPSTIKKCGVVGGVVSGEESVGGVVGRCRSSNNDVIACYNTSEVSGTDSVGGVIGDIYYSDNNATACYNTGGVSGTSNVGGIIGSGGSITACYYISAITHSDNSTRVTTISELNDAVEAMNSAAGEDCFTVNSDNILPSLFGEEVVFENPIVENMTIGSVEELKEFRDLVNSGWSPISATLTADLDLSGENWTPIGTAFYYCTTNFDGDGHTISNLTIDSSLDNQGLFGYIKGGSVSNLILKNPNVKGSQYVGAVCGCSDIDATFTNCGVVGGSISGTERVGGVIGNAPNSATRCYNSGEVSGTTKVGGVVGYGSVTECYNTGAVSATEEYVGGVVGYGSVSATACYNTGAVSGNSKVGGVIGNGKAIACYNTGSVSGSSEVGGINGYGNASASTACYYIGGIYVGSNNGIRITTISELNDAVEAMNSAAGEDYFTLNSGNILPSLFGEEVVFENPIVENMTIGSVEELKEFRDLVNSGWSPISATLTADLDLSGENWTPIGTAFYYCTTNFDGDGHTISNLTIDSSLDNQGLFGYIKGGSVSNLILKNPNVKGSQSVGAVCGYAQSSTAIKKCGVVGGVVSGTNSVGGVIGKAGYASSTPCYILGCYNTASISGTNYVGGVVGQIPKSNYGSYITACYNSGEVSSTGDQSYIGGVLGSAPGSITITDCYYISDTTINDYGTRVTSISELNDAVEAMNNAAGEVCYVEGAPAETELPTLVMP